MEQKIYEITVRKVQTPGKEKKEAHTAGERIYATLVYAALFVGLLAAGVGIIHNCWAVECEREEAAPLYAEKIEASRREAVCLTETQEELTQDNGGQAWEVSLTAQEVEALLTACEAGRIAPHLALGLIQVESSFDPNAVNPVSGCYGYCQLNPKYFPTGLTPEENIKVGLGYLTEQLERYDNLEAALTAYNAGHDTGDRIYAERVLTAAEEIAGKLSFLQVEGDKKLCG